jgi:hypothetical protein
MEQQTELQEKKDKIKNPRHHLAKALLYFRSGQYGRALYLCDTLIPSFAKGRPDEEELIAKRDKLRPKILEGLVEDVDKTAKKYGVSNYGIEFCELSEQCKIYRDLIKQLCEGDLETVWAPALAGATLTEFKGIDADYLKDNLRSIRDWDFLEIKPLIDLERCYSGLAYLESQDSYGKYGETYRKVRTLLDKIKEDKERK